MAGHDRFDVKVSAHSRKGIQGLVAASSRTVALVVGRDPCAGAEIVADLRQLGCIAIWVDASKAAIEMMETVQFGLILVSVDRPSEWQTCRRITSAASCPVAVVTHFLAGDRRYRDRAFRMGVAGYVRTPCTQRRLRELLRRVRAGEQAIEVVYGRGARPSRTFPGGRTPGGRSRNDPSGH
jgi:DNA-binding response OmpR family regulator